MASKTETAAARAAGRANITEPADRRGPAACPFPEGTDERAAWLEGLADALDEQPDPAELRKAIREAQA